MLNTYVDMYVYLLKCMSRYVYAALYIYDLYKYMCTTESRYMLNNYAEYYVLVYSISGQRLCLHGYIAFVHPWLCVH